MFYSFDESNFRYDYDTFTVGGLPQRGALNGARKLEVRFRNPDAALNHQLVWTYTDTAGKKHSDWMRFCTHESHADWRTRTVDIATDGYSAQQALLKGQKVDFVPARLELLQIYSTTSNRTGKEYHMDVDYVRAVK